MKKMAAATAALFAGAGVAAFAKSTIDIGRTYQDTLNNLKAVSGASTAQMDAVSKRAKELGGDLTLTATSAADAAIAMTELAKGGLTVDQAMAAAKGTLQLASAAGISAAEAATIQSSALNAFSLEADQAGRVSDVLANAANAAAGEIGDFALGMSQASAVAAATGISLEDTAATLGILANNGIKGSDAGTLLKSALLALQSPSGPAAKAMDKLSLSAYDASGNFVGLSSIFGQLQKAQKAMTPEAYAAATSTLFGSDAARLAGIAGKEGAAGFDAMAAAMGKQGSAADVAAAKAKGVTGAIESFKSQLEGIQIELFERFAPVLEGVLRALAATLPKIGDGFFWIFDKVTAFFGAINDIVVKGDFTKRVADFFNVSEDSPLVGFLLDVHDVLERVVNFIRDNAQPILAGLSAALAVLVTPAVIGLIGSLAATLGGALLSAFTALLSPIALVALAIGGLVAIFVAAYNDSEPLRAAVEKLKDAFGLFFDAFKNADAGGGISGFFDRIKAGIDAAWPTVKAALAEMGTALWSWIKDNIGPALAQLWEWVMAMDRWFYGTAIPAFVGFMADLAVKLWDWIAPMIGPALVQLGTWLVALADWIWNTGLPWLGDALADLGQALVDWIGPRIGPMLQAILDFAGELIGWLLNTGLPWLIETMADLAVKLWDWIAPMIPPMLKKIGEFLGELVGWLLFTGLPLLVGILLKLGWELISWIVPRIPEMIANIIEFVGKMVWWFLTEGLPWLAKTLFSFATGALAGLWDAFVKSPLISWITNWFGDMLAGIGRKWDEIKATFMGFVQWVTDTFWNNGLRKVWNWINDLWGGKDLDPINLVANVTRTGAGSTGGGGTAKRLATGGVLPGYTPGRDVHSFVSPTGGRLELSGGEAVMRPEFTRAMGLHGVNMLNAAARSGGVSGVAKALAAQTAYSQSHASGGIIDLPGWLDVMTKLPGAGFIGDVVGKINGGLGGVGTVAEGVLGMVKKAGSELWNKAKELFDGSNSGGPGVKGAASPNGVNGLGPKAAAARSFVTSKWGITNIGGYAPRNIAGTGTPSDHATGKALDIMMPNPYKSPASRALGNNIAEYFRTNPGAFGTKYVIYYDRIANGGAGWTPYRHPSGGSSDTLQHRDHVHVSVFDKGGVANGVGLMPKKTLKPERVLSPSQSEAFEDYLRGNTAPATGSPLVGVLNLSVGGNASVKEGLDEVNFQLRRIRRGSGGPR